MKAMVVAGKYCPQGVSPAELPVSPTGLHLHLWEVRVIAAIVVAARMSSAPILSPKIRNEKAGS
jgi:hypothetical protein